MSDITVEMISKSSGFSMGGADSAMPQPNQAMETDVAKFDTAYGGGSGSGFAVQNVNGTNVIFQTTAVGGADPLGKMTDSVAAGISTFRSGYDNKIKRFEQIVNGEIEVSPEALLALQIEVSEFTVITELTTKVAGKSTQNIDSLLRNQ